MPLRKTSVLPSTDPVSSDPVPPKTKRGRKTYRIITVNHVADALTAYLRSMSMIEDNEIVEHFLRSPEGLEVKIGVIHD